LAHCYLFGWKFCYCGPYGHLIRLGYNFCFISCRQYPFIFKSEYPLGGAVPPKFHLGVFLPPQMMMFYYYVPPPSPFYSISVFPRVSHMKYVVAWGEGFRLPIVLFSLGAQFDEATKPRERLPGIQYGVRWVDCGFVVKFLAFYLSFSSLCRFL